MSNHSPIFFLNQDNFGVYNVTIAKLFGIQAAVVLGRLTMSHEKFVYKEKIGVSHATYGSNWFFQTIDDLEEFTGLSRKEQDRAIKILLEANLIDSAVFNSPPKRHFRMNEDVILALFGLQKITTNMSNRDKSKCPKGTNSYVQSGQMHPYRNMNRRDEKNIHTRTPSPLKTDGVGTCDSADAECVSGFSFDQSMQHKIKNQDVTKSCQSSGPSANDLPVKVPPHDRPPPPKKSASKRKELPARAEDVHISDDDHKKLCDEFGVEDTEGAYLHLRDWKKSAKKSTVEKHSNDYLRIKNWAMLAYLERKSKMQKLKPAKSSSISDVTVTDYLKSWVIPQYEKEKIYIYPDKIRIESTVLQYTEKGFFLQLENILRNRQLSKRPQI